MKRLSDRVLAKSSPLSVCVIVAFKQTLNRVFRIIKCSSSSAPLWSLAMTVGTYRVFSSLKTKIIKPKADNKIVLNGILHMLITDCG